MTALSVYGLTSTSTTLATASNFVSANVGGANATNTTKIGTSTGYGEIFSLGTTNAWGAAGSIGSASGHGSLWDVTTLEGQQLISGNWTASIKCNTSVGSITADIYVRAFLYNGGSYTQIGSNFLLSAQTINTTYTIYTFSSVSQPAQNFHTGDKLYCDCWMNITANSTGSASATLAFGLSSNASNGLGNHFEVDTNGYQVIPSTHLRVCDGLGGVFS